VISKKRGNTCIHYVNKRRTQ